MGLMVPMIESAEQARLFVQSARYPPEGRRGCAFGVAHDGYRMGDLAETMRSANDEVLLIAQVETAAGLAHVDEIAAVPGIDVLWIGLFDLTTSMGLPGQFDHPDVRAAIDRILASAARHNRIPGILAFSIEEGLLRLKQGFRCVGYGGDIGLYQQALRQGLTTLRAARG
jgi:2-dehydro-3-deoxyglucarate aldolase/4-hydroxy-2-oxoheptanedioate aldolase